MSPAYKNIAIVGASGSIGKIILNGLIESSQFSITAITRKESEATFPAGVTIHKTDLSESDLEDAFKGKDAVISTVGAAGFAEQQKLVDAALRAGVKRFIPSEFSANNQNENVLKLLPLFGQKTELLKYLKTKESEGLTWTGIVPSLLFDWGLENGFLGFDIPNRKATIWDGGNKKFTLTNEKQLAQAVVSTLQRPEATKNQYLVIASVETSHKEILAALEEATAAKWEVTMTTTEEQVNDGLQKVGAGDFSGAFALVRAICFGSIPGLNANYVKDEKLGNYVLGLDLESVEETVKRVMKY
ncbi:NmrA-like family protein [Aspergillus steynii IBT 23096]|uniref:NmrA-like family protein n=1 Tax=Aspergillus steynii IBT 23096 TaxID=1392250 RepID=A0A2I2FWM0_9EURO|nr:NmrA-like family protein [Aspergillus steynii IBT 23096]PLB45043.1 NmrA-like family protein [Aspergillus steynii IBT 23096]